MKIGIKIRLVLLGLMVQAFSITGCGKSDLDKKNTSGKTESSELLVLAGAGLRPPIEEIARAFQTSEKDASIQIARDYAGSEALLGKIELSGRGDVFIPGDDFYVQRAQQKNLADTSVTLCRLVPVILVSQNNPKQIFRLSDLNKTGIRTGLGDARTCAIGKLSGKILSRAGVDLIPTFTAPTVNALVDQVRIGSLDAVLVWDAVAEACNCGDIIEIPPESNQAAHVEGAILRSSNNRKMGLKFLEFAASDTGRAIFARHNYSLENKL